jgi:hypothetical protein
VSNLGPLGVEQCRSATGGSTGLLARFLAQLKDVLESPLRIVA